MLTQEYMPWLDYFDETLDQSGFIGCCGNLNKVKDCIRSYELSTTTQFIYKKTQFPSFGETGKYYSKFRSTILQ